MKHFYYFLMRKSVYSLAILIFVSLSNYQVGLANNHIINGYDISSGNENSLRNVAPDNTIVPDVILFSEDWISESFETNNWSFDPAQGNWQINLASGNPEPSAQFHYQPAVTDYSYSLLTPQIEITGVDNLTLTFDLTLSDYAANGNEQFKVWILNEDTWELVEEFSNTGDIPWTTFTFDLSSVLSDITRVRFEATGLNSYDINHWMIDNIVLNVEQAPSFELTPTGYDFGQVVVGNTSEPQTFTMSNTGSGEVTISSVALSGTNASEFILDDPNVYPLTLNEGESSQVEVSFAPLSTGVFTASLTVETSLGIYESNLSGEGYTETVYQLPFEEDWISESFETNNWSFDPAQGNWQINLVSGNPEPSAQFHYQPTVTDYSYSLLTPQIEITGVDNLTLTFDLTLSDYAFNGNEQFKVWILNEDTWELVEEFSNTGDIPWTTFTFDLSSVLSDITRVRFEATGLNSYDINHWMIDNISLTIFDGIPDLKVSHPNIYPVPAKDILYVDALKDSQMIRIVDLTGRILFEESTHGRDRIQIDLSGFEGGTYLFQSFTGKHQPFTQKINIIN